MSLMGFSFPSLVGEKSEEKEGKKKKDNGTFDYCGFCMLFLEVSSILRLGMVKWRFMFS